MEFSVGDILRVDGDIYEVIGKIWYKNGGDYWFEYRMRHQGSGRVKWLSFDEKYREYSISEVVGSVSTSGYHLVDSGEEVVVSAWGDVDVETGDRARFLEYEDSTEEKIISSEIWDDGEEMSAGYYLDLDEIELVSKGAGTQTAYTNNRYNNAASLSNAENVKKMIILVCCLMFLYPVGVMLLQAAVSGPDSIAKYLKNSYRYEYVTSITGEQKQKADVYKTVMDLDMAAKDIIAGIEGDTVDVQQNTEDGDNSVAILTKREYCLVYVSEDGEVLVQVSTRKYAYANDTTPYHARSHTHRYYRRYYYSRAYTQDTASYRKVASPYSTFSDTTISSNSLDTYNTYSSSVRQSSVNTRNSSGGGMSSGK